MSNQGDRQASFRAISGKELDYNGDAIAACLAQGATLSNFEGAMIQWLQIRTGSSLDDLNGLLYTFAAQNGAGSWHELGSFNSTDAILAEDGGRVLSEDGFRILQE